MRVFRVCALIVISVISVIFLFTSFQHSLNEIKQSKTPKSIICYDYNGAIIINDLAKGEINYSNEFITYHKANGTKVTLSNDKNLFKCEEKEIN